MVVNRTSPPNANNACGFNVKDLECALNHEAEQRKEVDEDSLQSLMHEQERILQEKLQVSGEIQKTNTNVAVLESRVQEVNRRCNEAAGELKLIQDSIPSLQKEEQKIERQKMEAEHWLEKWRSRRQIGGTNSHGYVGLLNDVPDLVEFSRSDLQTATCDFSDSFKLFEGGCGSVYKGKLLNKTVVILRLHSHNIHTTHFQKEVFSSLCLRIVVQQVTCVFNFHFVMSVNIPCPSQYEPQ